MINLISCFASVISYLKFDFVFSFWPSKKLCSDLFFSTIKANSCAAVLNWFIFPFVQKTQKGFVL